MPTLQSPPKKQAWIAALVLVVGILVAYAHTASYEFVNFDDGDYVTGNPGVNQGLSGASVGWAFSSTYAANWHPLTWLSHQLDVTLFGLRAGGHHVTSVLLHALNAALFFLVLRRMTGRTWPSFFAAALFAWHPLRVESVAWISERKDLLSGTFWLLTLLAYTRYAKKPGAGGYAAVVLMVACSLMAKPMAVTLPFVLLLLDVWPLKRWRKAGLVIPSDHPFATRPPRTLLLEKLPLLGLCALSVAVTITAQRAAGATDLLTIPLGLRVQNAMATVGTYLYQTAAPFGLTAYYPHPVIASIDPEGALQMPALMSALLVLVLTGVLLWGWRAHRIGSPLIGWLWYLGTLIPVLGILQVGTQAHADRYTYIPAMGIALGVSFGLNRIVRRAPSMRPAILYLGSGALVVFLVLSARQVTFWKDSEALWNHALAVTTRNYKAHNNLGRILADRGELDQARFNFEEALIIRPGRPPDSEAAIANFNLAGIHALQGELPQAMARVERAVKLEREVTISNCADNPMGLNLVAWVLATSKQDELRDGPLALQLAKQICQATQFSHPPFLETLAAAHAEVENWDKAVKWQSEALQRYPRSQAAEAQRRLELYQQKRPVRGAF